MQVDRLTIVLPWPDKGLFPNAKNGKHWGSFQQKKTKARDDGLAAAIQALQRDKKAWVGSDIIPMKISFYAPDNRPRDWDGLGGSVKHHIDGMCKGLGIDDKAFNPVTVVRGKDQGKKGFVIVELG